MKKWICLPARLKELQRITRQEIDAVKREIEGSKSTQQ
jgi:hypothetical protein